MTKKVVKKAASCVNFKALSDSKKRIAIAEDVIQQLKVKKFTARTGSYVNLMESPFAEEIGWSLQSADDKQANFIIEKNLVQCEVCAKGAMFMSHVMKNNHTSIGEINDNHDDAVEPLKEYFDNEQLDLIESAFECDDIQNCSDDSSDSVDEDLMQKAINFGERYDDAEKRMIAIMKNIIKNGGIFKP